MNRILVVDDDPDIIKIVDTVLNKAGFDVYSADSALNAMSLLNVMPFDGIVSDANMPQFSGFEFIKTIRANRNLKHLPVAMLTGRREKKDIEKAVKVGVDDYIVKPINPMILIKKVKEMISESKPERKKNYVDFAATQTDVSAHIVSSIKVLAMTDKGLTCRSSIHYEEGAILHIQIPQFKALNIEIPSLRTVHCKTLRPNKEYELQLNYFEATAVQLDTIKNWVASKAG